MTLVEKGRFNSVVRLYYYLNKSGMLPIYADDYKGFFLNRPDPGTRIDKWLKILRAPTCEFKSFCEKYMI